MIFALLQLLPRKLNMSLLKALSFLCSVPIASSVVDLLGVPQPYSIFIDELNPIPAFPIIILVDPDPLSSPSDFNFLCDELRLSSKLKCKIFVLMAQLLWEELHNPNTARCPDVNSMTDPIVSDAIDLLDAYRALLDGNGECEQFEIDKVCLKSRAKIYTISIYTNITDDYNETEVRNAIERSDTINMTTDIILDYHYNQFSNHLEIEVQRGMLNNSSRSELVCTLLDSGVVLLVKIINTTSCL